MTTASGDKYEGEWEKDKRHGQGTNTWASGGKYVGKWVDHKMHGHGTYEYASGDKYEGEWEDDKKHGHGTIEYSSGGKYEGEWKNGKPGTLQKKYLHWRETMRQTVLTVRTRAAIARAQTRLDKSSTT